jgi:hypothetical protein
MINLFFYIFVKNKTMNINKALEHFKFKFQNSWKPTPRDIEAYNAIVEFKTLQETKNLSEHETLAKLWIHQMVLLSRTKLYSGERSIQVIDEILNKSVYDWCVILQNEIPLMRFQSIGNIKYQLTEESVLNRTKLRERDKNIIDNHSKELRDALVYEISEDDIIKFVERQITRIINKYEK